MKKKLLFIVALAFIGAATSVGQLKYGGGLTLGTESGGDGDAGIGINARVDYAINENITITPNFTYWFPSSDYGDISYWQLNGDVHYIFAGDEILNFYGIAGLNYSYIKYEFDMGMYGSGSFSDSEIGLNLGAGANMGMFFGELKYDTAFEQLALTIGVLF